MFTKLGHRCLPTICSLTMPKTRFGSHTYHILFPCMCIGCKKHARKCTEQSGTRLSLVSACSLQEVTRWRTLQIVRCFNEGLRNSVDLRDDRRSSL